MRKTLYPEIFNKELLYSIPGYVYFLYLLSPFRFWESFVFSNQTEIVVITVFFACILLLFVLLKTCKTTTLQLNKIDLCLIVYGIYLLFRLEYPVEKEYFFQAFSIICIYLYSRNFPEKYLEGLLILIPVAGIVQVVDGINRFTQPWQNISHITGIFNNTGLFGGFAALGLVICAGLLFSSYSHRHHKKSIVSVLIAFKALTAFVALILAKQVLASGSRASWLATLGAILFLLHRFFPQWKTLPKSRMAKYFLVMGILVLSVFFLKYLYDLKKESADGRLLIGRISMEMVKDAPVFGKGISGFRSEYMNYQADYFQTHPDSRYLMNADDVQTPFNELLKILIEQGIVGLLLFCCLLYYLNGTRMTRIYAAILFILIFGLFSYPFDKLPFSVLFICFLAILSQDRNPVFTIRLRKMRYLRIPLLLALGLVSWKIAVNAHSYAKSCKTWNWALTHYASGKKEALSQLKELYPKLENNPVYLITYGKVLNLSERYQEAIVVLEQAVQRQPLSDSYIELGKSYEAEGFPERAPACWKHASLMVPARFTPMYLTMKLHFKNQEYDRARECAAQLLSKKIKIDNPEIDPMKREARYILSFHPPPE